MRCSLSCLSRSIEANLSFKLEISASKSNLFVSRPERVTNSCKMNNIFVRRPTDDNETDEEEEGTDKTVHLEKLYFSTFNFQKINVDRTNIIIIIISPVGN